MDTRIAIVGMACRYPDAKGIGEFWENVLAQRRAFRRIPSERLRLEDYSGANNDGDTTYVTDAALIDGYEFQRVRFKVPGGAYRSADVAHWLALDVASDALADAGFADGAGLPLETTGVLVGNTLTGEFSRAAGMRLRWPFVYRVVDGVLDARGWTAAQRSDFLSDLQRQYKAPFEPVSEETLAGGLSNTIAGRICNYFNLKGCGYTLDGACASSLIAVTDACSKLVVGDLDVALAGGVDVSIDPFELVGFAKLGALARDEMRVFDRRSSGFLPGEGCGFVVLMRHEDALAMNLRCYATIAGWGLSSDGKGGITRPEADGQALAISRAYRRAGFGVESIGYFEGHGTGTPVGDATEIKVLSKSLSNGRTASHPATLGSIKANIGHTKAAAGIAGLLKAALAIHHQVLPPTTGCNEPRAELNTKSGNLRVLSKGQLWPETLDLKAGVSAMGFGGINSHIVVEAGTSDRRNDLTGLERKLLRSKQDSELILFSAKDDESLLVKVELLMRVAKSLSYSELGDLGCELAKDPNEPLRAAIVTSSPKEFGVQLLKLREWLREEVSTRLDSQSGIFLGYGEQAPRIGFLFPGQASPTYLDGGAIGDRFDCVEDLYRKTHFRDCADPKQTQVAQPAVVTASLAGLRVLESLGIEAEVAIGHSLGELTAMHWAGVLDEESTIRIAKIRGLTMQLLGNANGAMASVRASADDVDDLIEDLPVVIAAINSPTQTVISGEAAAITTAISRANGRGFAGTLLPVSHAFHSPLVAAAVPEFGRHIDAESFSPARRRIVSTLVGTDVAIDQDLRSILLRQITEPVRFSEALAAAVPDVDIWIEVGPGKILAGLAKECGVRAPAISLDAGGSSLKGLLGAIGSVFALGGKVELATLLESRFTRPFDVNRPRQFFVNPCETAHTAEKVEAETTSIEGTADASEPDHAPDVSNEAVEAGDGRSVLEVVTALIADRAELPPQSVNGSDGLLADLHFNSLDIAQLLGKACGKLVLPLPADATQYATATVAEFASALVELQQSVKEGGGSFNDDAPAGADFWVRAFTVDLAARPPSKERSESSSRDGTPQRESGDGWSVFAPPEYKLAGQLRAAFSQAQGTGVVVAVPPGPTEPYLGLLLKAVRAILERKTRPQRFVVVQHGGRAAAIARSLQVETRQIATCVVDVPIDHPDAIKWILAEAQSATGHSEAYYDAKGCRHERLLRLMPLLPQPGQHLLGPDDVLLVTGGGKGIAAESALALARETGTKLALLGRSLPAGDPILAENLSRLDAYGIKYRYVTADVTDSDGVARAVRDAQEALGPITAIIHGAGANTPKLISNLEEHDFRDTLAPKLDGLRHVLAALDPSRLRLLVTFGSIIAKIGLPGEADYALANDLLAELTTQFSSAHPKCRCLCLEWSIWSGVGMGERLGRIDALLRQGITPISPDQGVAILSQLIRTPSSPVSIIISGRFGKTPTLEFEEGELPFWRFLEQPRVYYPGIELVVDAELSASADPYLEDHVVSGNQLLPGVFGLEAIAQVAMALAGKTEPPTFKNVEFVRFIAVPADSPIKIRIAALLDEDGEITAVVRSQDTLFQADHFRAKCYFPPSRPVAADQSTGWLVDHPADGSGNIPIRPLDDLYGRILFHKGRFARVAGYRSLSAKECTATIASDGSSQWFASYLPANLVLGDPGARDAAIHAIQACIPHSTILPVGIERLHCARLSARSPLIVQARERSHDGNFFTYDVELSDAGGVVERWDGLQLRAVGATTVNQEWPASLLVPYLERQLSHFVPGANISIAITSGECTDPSPNRSIAAANHSTIYHRPDGKPEMPSMGGSTMSSAHSGLFRFSVFGSGPLGCDLEFIDRREAALWASILGPDRTLLSETVATRAIEDLDSAATRVWTAMECLKKSGMPFNAPLSLDSAGEDGWVNFAVGNLVVATYTAQLKESSSKAVFAVLTRRSQ